MARIVMKFGGTSMAGTERIRTVAKLVAREVTNGNEVAVVVSAMAGETDRLVNFCREANPRYDPAEYDVVVAAGEQITSGLLALTLQAMGVPARSWLGWQLPIRTEEAHARARILDIDTGALLAAMGKGEVAVIPGFQGMMDDGRVSTLGRGGSDTSAVAVAAAVKADRCDIYTDVDGVYTTDPRIVARARKLDYVTYEEMLELASVGAKVLQTRSVGLAMKMGVRVQVLSSFVEGDEPARAATIALLHEAWEVELKAHFADEELLLKPHLSNRDMARLIEEHRALERHIKMADHADCAPSAEWLRETAAMLEDHIRWEERELFPAAERAGAEGLDQMAHEADRIERERPGARRRQDTR